MCSIWCCQINPLVLAIPVSTIDTIPIPYKLASRQFGGRTTKGPPSMDLSTDTTDFASIVASLRDHEKKAREAIAAHSADIVRATELMTDAVRLFLATVSADAVIVKLPEELAGFITEVWVAQYVVWKKPSVPDTWQRLPDYVHLLVKDMGWGVYDRETADPHPQSVGQPVWISLQRWR